MANGIYSALSGAIAQSERLDSVANNLANLSTPGFRQEELIFRDVLSQRLQTREHAQDINFTHVDGSYLRSEQGALQLTSRSLDAAIEGRGYFTVQTPDGIAFTRNGHFQIDQNGTLVSASGTPLLAVNGPIRIPVDAQVRFDKDGRVYADDNMIAQLSIADIDERGLFAVGGGLYRATTASAVPRLQNPLVHGQTLEGSNVNALRSMTELITTNRIFEATQNAIDTYRQLDSKAASELSRR